MAEQSNLFAEPAAPAVPVEAHYHADSQGVVRWVSVPELREKALKQEWLQTIGEVPSA